MRFEQVHKLLDHTREFHHRLAEHYGRLGQVVERERTRMLLDYVAQVEHTLEHALADYEADASRMVLDTWLDFSDDERFLSRLEQLGTTSEIALDDVVPEVFELHSTVLAAYESIDLGSVPPEVGALVEDVIAFEKQQGKRLSRAAGQLREL